jgi:hypothetical protein
VGVAGRTVAHWARVALSASVQSSSSSCEEEAEEAEGEVRAVSREGGLLLPPEPCP